MKNNKNTKELIQQLSEKYNRPKNVIYEAVNMQFKVVAENMKNKKETRLPFFGVFKINTKRIERRNEIFRKARQFKDTESS